MQPSTTIVAKAFLLNTSNKVLVMRREPNDDRRPGQWDVPGGSVDDNEDFAAAIARETTEEAGLTIPKAQFELRYAQTTIRNETEKGGEYANVIRLCFVVKQNEYSTIVLSHEHDEYRWATIVEAGELLANNKWGDALQYLTTNKLLY